MPELNPVDRGGPDVTYAELDALYKLHIQAETEWLREMNRQRKVWEDRTLWFRALLEPYWEGERE
jgi:hypothetical protein